MSDLVEEQSKQQLDLIHQDAEGQSRRSSRDHPDDSHSIDIQRTHSITQFRRAQPDNYDSLYYRAERSQRGDNMLTEEQKLKPVTARLRSRSSDQMLQNMLVIDDLYDHYKPYQQQELYLPDDQSKHNQLRRRRLRFQEDAWFPNEEGKRLLAPMLSSSGSSLSPIDQLDLSNQNIRRYSYGSLHPPMQYRSSPSEQYKARSNLDNCKILYKQNQIAGQSPEQLPRTNQLPFIQEQDDSNPHQSYRVQNYYLQQRPPTAAVQYRPAQHYREERRPETINQQDLYQRKQDRVNRRAFQKKAQQPKISQRVLKRLNQKQHQQKQEKEKEPQINATPRTQSHRYSHHRNQLDSYMRHQPNQPDFYMRHQPNQPTYVFRKNNSNLYRPDRPQLRTETNDLSHAQRPQRLAQERSAHLTQSNLSKIHNNSYFGIYSQTNQQSKALLYESTKAQGKLMASRSTGFIRTPDIVHQPVQPFLNRAAYTVFQQPNHSLRHLATTNSIPFDQPRHIFDQSKLKSRPSFQPVMSMFTEPQRASMVQSIKSIRTDPKKGNQLTLSRLAEHRKADSQIDEGSLSRLLADHMKRVMGWYNK